MIKTSNEAITRVEAARVEVAADILAKIDAAPEGPAAYIESLVAEDSQRKETTQQIATWESEGGQTV